MCSGTFKLLDLVLIYHDKAPIFSMCGFNVSIVHSNFSKYLFQFFKCVNTLSLQGPVKEVEEEKKEGEEKE